MTVTVTVTVTVWTVTVTVTVWTGTVTVTVWTVTVTVTVTVTDCVCVTGTDCVRRLYSWTVMENHISLLPTRKERLLSYAQTHVWYCLKLVYPWHLCFDYGYACIPTVHTWIDWRCGILCVCVCWTITYCICFVVFVWLYNCITVTE